MHTTTMYSAPPVDIPPIPTPLKRFHNRHYPYGKPGEGGALYWLILCTETDLVHHQICDNLGQARSSPLQQSIHQV